MGCLAATAVDGIGCDRERGRPAAHSDLWACSTAHRLFPACIGTHAGATHFSCCCFAPIPSADNVASDPETDVPDLRITYEPEERTSGVASE